MITNHFYNSLLKKYIALFGSIFNQLEIHRISKTGDTIQELLVPISYAPHQKFLTKIAQDPNNDKRTSLILPRLSYEIVNLAYDPTRKLTSLKKLTSDLTNVYVPAPYTIDFNLYIMTEYIDDGNQLIEQILPFFKPERTYSVELLKDFDPINIPIVLQSVVYEDTYEADFETRRMIMWTLSFSMKSYFFGPVRESKVIKFIDTRFIDKTELAKLTIQPGLTNTGLKTTNIDETIPYQEINESDDWGIIIQTTDLN